MSNGMIGYTGFVGSNLICQEKYDYFYNSKNIESIVGKDLDLLVCAGTPAVKWLANKNPIQDRENLQRLMDCLTQVSAQKVILISTVDVYSIPIKVTEKTEINIKDLHPYGKHRLDLEMFMKHHFNTLIIRLPGLFGSGLKKNAIYDLLHHNQTEKIHRNSKFQFYNLEHLWQDIQKAIALNLTLVNFATEPTTMAEVAAEAFGFELTNESEESPVRYDMQTQHFQLFNGYEPGYLYSKKQVLQELKDFVIKVNNVGDSTR
jgi:nucleoside-diphosphate-sugar epimerase